MINDIVVMIPLLKEERIIIQGLLMSIKISSEANRLKGVHLGEIKNFKK